MPQAQQVVHLEGWALVLEFMRLLLWPVVVTLLVLVFRKAIEALLGRGGKVQYGSFSFETSAATKQLAQLGSFENATQLSAAVAEAIQRLPGNIPDEQVEEAVQDSIGLPPEYLPQALLPFIDTCVDRLEYVSGMPIGTLRRYAALRSEALATYIEGGSLQVAGYYEAQNQRVIAVVFWDIENFAGRGELAYYVGAMLSAVRAAFGEECDWRLIVGVLPGQPDSVGRIINVQGLFAPAIKSGKLSIVELSYSRGMEDALVHGLHQAVTAWRQAPQGEAS